ncbi:hypothetical protein CO2235_MP10219 [Cupriavidus oxalaticus]|uniref:Uncharacterized protein n=1 Tax=Cupriavidus oxalaticus TaxID=96344 RepID=A0A375GCB9_9BURK|nr:hypothetical protein CO2235_MP10219 [Cupriavidus oxalaticus]
MAWTSGSAARTGGHALRLRGALLAHRDRRSRAGLNPQDALAANDGPVNDCRAIVLTRAAGSKALRQLRQLCQRPKQQPTDKP